MNWPGETLILNIPKALTGTEITMLGYEGKISWEMQGGALHIDVPQLTINKLPCRHAWVFKIPGAAE